MYEFTDKHIEQIKKNIKAYFHNSRLSIMKYDELNVSIVDDEIDKLFDKIDELSTASIKKEINALSKQYGFDSDIYTAEQIVEMFNSTTMYVHKNELDRKRARYKEAMLSTLVGNSNKAKNKYVKDKPKALNSLTFPREVIIASFLSSLFVGNQRANINNIGRQIEETLLEAERYMYIDNGIKNDVKYVKWITEHDDRVCADCEQYDGMIFEIDNVASRPHIGCRCELEYVTDEEEID